MGDTISRGVICRLERIAWQGYTVQELTDLCADIEEVLTNGFLSKRETRGAQDRVAAIARELDRRIENVG